KGGEGDAGERRGIGRDDDAGGGSRGLLRFLSLLARRRAARRRGCGGVLHLEGEHLAGRLGRGRAAEEGREVGGETHQRVEAGEEGAEFLRLLRAGGLVEGARLFEQGPEFLLVHAGGRGLLGRDAAEPRQIPEVGGPLPPV